MYCEKGRCCMKKSKKIALIISGSCIVVGGILILIAGIMTGFDFKKFRTTEYAPKVCVLTEEFSGLNVNVKDADIRIYPSKDESCKVMYQDSTKLIHNVYVENGTLFVTTTDTRTWKDWIGIHWDEELNVSIYLPEAEYASLKLETASGDIDVPADFVFQQAELVTTSGDVGFLGATKEKILAKSTSGEVFVKNIQDGTVEVESTSGNVELEQISATSVKAGSTSGDVELNQVVASGELLVKTVSGEIELEAVDAENLSLQATSGDVEGTLLSDKQFVTDTTSGEIRVPKSDDSAGICEIKTVSGDIQIRVAR